MVAKWQVDMLTCNFFCVAKLTLQHRLKESKVIGRWHCFAQSQNTKPLLLWLTTHFSTLFQIPIMPKPNLLSHEPNLQLHWWWLQFRSETMTVSFSSLSLQLMVKAKELPSWFEAPRNQNQKQALFNPLIFFYGDSTWQKAQKEAKRLILRKQNWVIGVKSHMG